MSKYFLCSLFIISLWSNVLIGQEGHDIEFDLPAYDNDTLVAGYFYGTRQLVLDTLYRNKKGLFILEGEEHLHPGVYLFLSQIDNSVHQFLIPDDDQKFKVTSTLADFSDLSYKGSDENQLFDDYVSFLAEKRPLIEGLQNAQLEASTDEEKDKIQGEIEAVNADVEAEQQRIIQEFPNSITTILLKANQPIDVPEFTELSAEERKNSRYRYYKEHYFDHIDLSDSVTLYTPFINDRVRYYMDKLTLQTADSIGKSMDYLLAEMGPGSKMFKYYLGDFYNYYAKSKMVGMDGVVVHLVDNYYAKGQAPWVEQETLDKIIDNVNKMKPSLMGKIAQDITVYKEDGSPISLDSIDFEYLVLLFWAPDCGHCKKVMPKIVEFGDKFQERGVEVFAICTKHMDKVGTCWESIEEKNMTGFINAADEYHRSRFKTKYDVRTTPKIFILDKNKKIIIKGIGGEQLDEVMTDILANQTGTPNE